MLVAGCGRTGAAHAHELIDRPRLAIPPTRHAADRGLHILPHMLEAPVILRHVAKMLLEGRPRWAKDVFGDRIEWQAPDPLVAQHVSPDVVGLISIVGSKRCPVALPH